MVISKAFTVRVFIMKTSGFELRHNTVHNIKVLNNCLNEQSQLEKAQFFYYFWGKIKLHNYAENMFNA